MENEAVPLDADELMNFSERIEALPAADAEWASALFAECLRARMREAELLCAQSEPSPAADAAQPADFAQLALDCADWLKTLWEVGYMGAGNFPAPPRTAFPVVDLEDVTKSALFARIRQGKRPLPFPPPTRKGLPWHDLLDDTAAEHAVAAEIVRDERGAALGAIIEGCAGWGVVAEVAGAAECLVQHRATGPLYRLQFGPGGARLRRQPPAWTRTIRMQERGGFRSYQLEWPQDGGEPRNIALRAATWERAEAEAAYWIAANHPAMYGQVRFEQVLA